MQVCKGKCEIDKMHVDKRNGLWDKKNMSFCYMCSVNMITTDYKCHCCGTLLRKRPHGRKWKERLRNIAKS